ncbi:MAG: enoyl-CoA hydratase/isomerase family protein [Burkholderiales bacterium]
MTSVLTCSIHEAVAQVVLQRPQVRNAFNETLIAELHRVFVQLNQDPQVRVVVLAAQGPAFCAGADLNWMRAMAGYSYEQNLADARGLAAMLHALDTCNKPVIARVQGDTYAGGIGLLAVCDLVVAVQSAQFCLSEVKLGLVPATIAPYVVRAIGLRQARRYALTAEKWDAAEAFRMGLVHDICTPEELDDKVHEWIQAVLNNSPQAVAVTKQLLHKVADSPLDERLREITAEHIAQARGSADGQAGVQAFLNKQKPGWVR